MANDNTIVINIELDSSKSTAEFKKIEEQATGTYKRIGKGIENNVKAKTAEASSPVKDLFYSLKKVSTLIATAPPYGKGLFGFVTSISFTSNAVDVLGEGLLKIC